MLDYLFLQTYVFVSDGTRLCYLLMRFLKGRQCYENLVQITGTTDMSASFQHVVVSHSCNFSAHRLSRGGHMRRINAYNYTTFKSLLRASYVYKLAIIVIVLKIKSVDMTFRIKTLLMVRNRKYLIRKTTKTPLAGRSLTSTLQFAP